MENLKTKLGRRIKNLRKDRNITQEQLAEMINMDITSLSKIETGRNYPQSETLERISDALNVDVDKLFQFNNRLCPKDYVDGINKNIRDLYNNEEKLKILYCVSSALI